MWPKKLLRKFQLWIMTRKEYREIILTQNSLLNKKILNWTERIETLDQDRIYIILVDDIEQATGVHNSIVAVSKRLKWTMPKFIILILKKQKFFSTEIGR